MVITGRNIAACRAYTQSDRPDNSLVQGQSLLRHQGPPPLPDAIQNNTQIQQFQRQVHEYAITTRPANTAGQYDPKVVEFHGCCDNVWGSQPQSIRYLVDPNKTYGFPWFVAHRPKRKTGKKQKGKAVVEDNETVNTQAYHFNVEEYRATVEQQTSEGTITIDPVYPVGFQSVNAYRNALKDLWNCQVAEHSNTWDWSHDCYTHQVKALLKMVKEQKPLLDKKKYAEKVDHVFGPYHNIDKIPVIEEHLFAKALDKSSRQTLTALRDHYTFLQLHYAVLRGETLFKESKTDQHPMLVMTTRVAIGKTNQVGHAMQHREH